MAHLVTLLLPLKDNEGEPYAPEVFDDLRSRLLKAHGGVTVFGRAPGEGLWRNGGKVEADEVVIFEVMVEGLDRAWWSALRAELEVQLGQDEIVVRAAPIERL